jgi:single-strand DNA-binding protein
MNKVILIGNITKDPEIKVSMAGKKVANISLAINSGKDANGNPLTQYFNCVAFSKVADIIELYTKKGHKVAIAGSLQNNTWDKPDGTKGYSTNIIINELEMLTSKKDAGQQEENTNTGSEFKIDLSDLEF